MLDLIYMIGQGMEYAGDLMLCIGLLVFLGLVAMDDGV